jgi:hypothetical protein
MPDYAATGTLKIAAIFSQKLDNFYPKTRVRWTDV